MGFGEYSQTFFEQVELFGAVELRDADADSRLAAAGRGERNGADAVEQQFAQQLRAGQIAVADRVEESVAYRLVLILVVDDAETVAQEQFLREPCAACVFRRFGHEIQPAVGRGAEHRREGVLGRMAPDDAA